MLKSDFQNACINKGIFYRALFKDLINFNETGLEDMDFSNCAFDDFVSFANAKFNGNIIFNNTRFNKGLSLYNANFKDIPNFGGASLNGSVNIVNMILAKDNIYELRIRLEDEFEKKHILQNEFDKKIKIVNDYRDTFKFLKNGALKENNNFEANKFHRLELYAREEELKVDENSTGIIKNTKDFFTNDLRNRSDFAQNIKSFSLLVDEQILKFYRILSDHHTSLLKVFNNLIILIAFFSLSVIWVLEAKQENNYLFSGIRYDLERILVSIVNTILLLEFNLAIFLDCLYVLMMMIFLFDYIKELCLEFTKNNKKSVLDFQDGALFIIMSFLIFVYFDRLYYISIKGYFSIYDTLFFSLLFVMIYIYLISQIEIFRAFIIAISYFVCFKITFFNLTIISPFFGKILFDNDKFKSNQLILSLSITYTILMFLVLFSLQKTARRNSIVPA